MRWAVTAAPASFDCLYCFLYLQSHCTVYAPRGYLLVRLLQVELQWAAAETSILATDGTEDENGTEISRTEPHRFLYLIRSNPYFLVQLYRFRFRIWDISYFKCKSRKWFTHFSTVFYFSTFNLKYSEFKIRFKPNLTNCTGHTAQLQAAHHADAFFLLVASCPLL